VLAAGATDNAMLAFGWNHPITHIIGTAVAITLGARAVAGEIENGAIELVLAQPVSRAHYLTAHILFAAFAILSIAVLGVLATAIGQRVFALEPFPPARLALLLLAFLLLQLAIFAITLIASTFGREGGRAALAGLFVAVVSYMVGAIASLGRASATSALTHCTITSIRGRASSTQASISPASPHSPPSPVLQWPSRPGGSPNATSPELCS